MYVCICNAVTDSHIADALDAGARYVDDLTHSLGLGSCCGTCVELAEAVIDSHRRSPARALPTDSGVYRYVPAPQP